MSNVELIFHYLKSSWVSETLARPSLNSFFHSNRLKNRSQSDSLNKCN